MLRVGKDRGAVQHTKWGPAMRNVRLHWLLIGCGCAISLTAQAQPRQPAFSLVSATGLDSSAQRGQGLFLQNCSLCHLPHRKHPKDSTDPGRSIGPALTTLLRGSVEGGAQDAAVANVIRRGSAHMPGFQYALSSADIADILAYLRVLGGSLPGLFQMQQSPGVVVTSRTAGGPKASTTARLANGSLAGTVRSINGRALAGVAVSARCECQSFTTSVYTDGRGEYRFPPVRAGRYAVWAQAVGYRAAQSDLVIASDERRQQQLTLDPLGDFQNQLSGTAWMNSLPADTLADRRLRQLFHNNCTVCHVAGFVLEKRFDRSGWATILDTMIKDEADPTRPNGKLLQAYRNELIDYLTRVRGPRSAPLRFKVPPRPRGEAANIVVTEYDAPRGDWPGYRIVHNGSLWQEGVPSQYEGEVLHDAVPEGGDVYFTDDVTPGRTIGKVDAQTGLVTNYVLPDREGFATSVHGVAVDPQGNLWFADQPDGIFVRFDPRTAMFRKFPRSVAAGPARLGIPAFDTLGNFLAKGMGGTLVVDARGEPWAAEDVAALELQPATGRYREYAFRARGGGEPDGIALAGGEVWVTKPAADTISIIDKRTGRATVILLSPLAGVGAADEAIGRRIGASTNTAPLFQKGARRIAADPDGQTVWVTEQWAGRLARIDTHNHRIREYELPNPLSLPFQPVVDAHHRVWFCEIDSDRVGRFDPRTKTFTEFPLPTLGTTARFIALDERSDPPIIWVAYTGTNKIARLQFR